MGLILRYFRFSCLIGENLGSRTYLIQPKTTKYIGVNYTVEQRGEDDTARFCEHSTATASVPADDAEAVAMGCSNLGNNHSARAPEGNIEYYFWPIGAPRSESYKRGGAGR